MLSLEGFVELDAAFAGVSLPDQAFAIACDLAGKLGFEHVIHAPVRNHPAAGKNWAATSYPADWRETYVAKKYLARNPVRQKALSSNIPFFWSALEAELPETQREIFHDCRATGMHEGLVVPIHGPWGQVVAIGFACQSKKTIGGSHCLALQALAYKLHHVFDSNQIKKTAARITLRENEILQCLAEGMQSTAIADRLKISDNSVEWHLKNIYRKLAVNNRTAAVVTAIQRGLLYA